MMVGLGHEEHQMGKGISKRTVRMPCEVSLEARFLWSLLADVVPSTSGGT